MGEWKEYKLGDFMEFNPKISLPKNTIARKIAMDQLVPHSRDIFSWIYEPYSGGAKFQNGDTIMARITPCLENGKQAYVSCLEEGETAFGSTEYIVMRGRDGISDNVFIYYLTLCPDFRNTAIKSMVGSSGRQRAQVDVLENKIMCLPSISEQQKIASILSSLDDKIEENRRINENLEQQAQALFKSWFVDFEPFKDGEFVESELGMIPKGWRVIELQDVVKIKRGGSPRPIQAFLSESGYKWLKISDATACKSPFLYDIKEHIKESGLSKTILLKPGSLVLSNSATPGIPKILGVESCVHDGWLYFPQSELSKYYLYLLFIQNRNFLLSQGNGSVFTNLKTDILKTLKIVLPSKHLLWTFDKIIESLFIQIENKTKESRRLASLRDTLLPRLMSGEIRVDEINVL